MGNRAVITTYTGGEVTYGDIARDKIGVYLHWNGGRDSVEAFLKYCELKEYRYPESDCYGWARLCQVIGNFFGGELSLGIDTLGRLDCDNGDNGVYVIQKWKIIDRRFFEGREQNNYDLLDMLIGIDEKQPKDEQLGKTKIIELLQKEKEQQ